MSRDGLIAILVVVLLTLGFAAAVADDVERWLNDATTITGE